jgi:large subunit ribosomal protein L25
MEEIILKATVRKELGKKVNVGRKSGMIPAVLYGKGVGNDNLWIKALDLKRLLNKSGESVIINLEVEGGKKYSVLINEMQKNPVSEDYIHVDFYRVKMDEAIETEIELIFVGESKAVKEAGGVLVKSLDKLKIKCLPKDLPSHIDVDISSLDTFDDHIAIKDLKINPAIEIKIDLETVVASVAPPRSEEELKELEGKVEEDVTKVEGVVKEVPEGETPAEPAETAKAPKAEKPEKK